MRYGIQPLKNITDSYQYLFLSLAEARNAAAILAEKHACEILVFRIVGRYKPELKWYGEEDGDG